MEDLSALHSLSLGSLDYSVDSLFDTNSEQDLVALLKDTVEMINEDRDRLKQENLQLKQKNALEKLQIDIINDRLTKEKRKNEELLGEIRKLERMAKDGTHSKATHTRTGDSSTDISVSYYKSPPNRQLRLLRVSRNPHRTYRTKTPIRVLTPVGS